MPRSRKELLKSIENQKLHFEQAVSEACKPGLQQDEMKENIFSSALKLLNELTTVQSSLTLLEIEEKQDCIIAGTLFLLMAYTTDRRMKYSFAEYEYKSQGFNQPPSVFMDKISETDALKVHLWRGSRPEYFFNYDKYDFIKLIPLIGRAALLEKPPSFLNLSLLNKNSLLGKIVFNAPFEKNDLTLEKYGDYAAYRQKQLYKQAYHDQEQALASVEARFKANLLYAYAAFILSPLSLRYTVPAFIYGLSKPENHNLKNIGYLVLMVVASLIPGISYFTCKKVAEYIKDEETPPQRIVKMDLKGPKEAVRAAHKTKRKEFKEKNSIVPWDELKKPGLAISTEIEDECSEIMRDASDSEAKRYSVEQGDDQLLPRKAKKVYETYTDDKGEVRTAVLLGPEDAKRWRFIEGDTIHDITRLKKDNGIDHRESRTIDCNTETTPKNNIENDEYQNGTAQILTDFFAHSRIQSAKDQGELENKYRPSSRP